MCTFFINSMKYLCNIAVTFRKTAMLVNSNVFSVNLKKKASLGIPPPVPPTWRRSLLDSSLQKFLFRCLHDWLMSHLWFVHEIDCSRMRIYIFWCPASYNSPIMQTMKFQVDLFIFWIWLAHLFYKLLVLHFYTLYGMVQFQNISHEKGRKCQNRGEMGRVENLQFGDKQNLKAPR